MKTNHFFLIILTLAFIGCSEKEKPPGGPLKVNIGIFAAANDQSRVNGSYLAQLYRDDKIDSVHLYFPLEDTLAQLVFLKEVGFVNDDSTMNYTSLCKMSSRAVQVLMGNAAKYSIPLKNGLLISGATLNRAEMRDDFIRNLVAPEFRQASRNLELFASMYYDHRDEAIGRAITRTIEMTNTTATHSFMEEVGYLVTQSGGRASYREEKLNYLPKSALKALSDKYNTGSWSWTDPTARNLKDLAEDAE